MGYPRTDDGKIRVFVDEDQRDLLEFCVNRRLAEVEHSHQKLRAYDARTTRLRNELEADLLKLRALKREVQQAGT